MAGNQIVCRPSEKVKNALMEAKDAVVAGVGTNWAHKEMQNKKSCAKGRGNQLFNL